MTVTGHSISSHSNCLRDRWNILVGFFSFELFARQVEYPCRFLPGSNDLSSCVYVPSRRLSNSRSIVHVSHPYSRILSTHALKYAIFVLLTMFDCHIWCSLLHAAQACALCMMKSFLLSATKEPRYLKSLTSLSVVPSREMIAGWFSSSLISKYLVLSLFRVRTTSYAAFSTDSNRLCTLSDCSAVKAISSASSRSVTCLLGCLEDFRCSNIRPLSLALSMD